MSNKDLILKKEGFFTKIINKIKCVLKKENKEDNIQKISQKEETSIKEYNSENDVKKDEFLDNMKVEINSELITLKMKLDSGEIKGVDLTDEQIDELQKLYDKEIEEKKIKIKKLKN